MRLWVWLGWALVLPSCSGDYPLPPTPCDDFCHATQGPGCPSSYEPAGCVAWCESAGFGIEACRPALDAVVQCYGDTPAALEQRCAFYDSGGVQAPACSLEYTLLSDCSGLSFSSSASP
jgi:hypothetical protein